MTQCIVIPEGSRNLSAISTIYLQNLPILPPMSPYPYAANFVDPGDKVKQIIGECDSYQVIDLRLSPRPAPNARYCFIAPAISQWRIENLMEIRNKFGDNPAASYMSKSNQIFGKAIMYKIDDSSKPADITPAEAREIYEKRCKLCLNPDEKDGMFIFRAADHPYPVGDTEEKRRQNVLKIAQIIRNRRLIHLEMLYLAVLPQMYKSYIMYGRQYSDSMMNYCFGCDPPRINTFLIEGPKTGSNKSLEFKFESAKHERDHIIPGDFEEIYGNLPQNCRTVLPFKLHEERQNLLEKADKSRKKMKKIRQKIERRRQRRRLMRRKRK